MFIVTLSFYLLFASAAARRCVDKYYATPECLTQCQSKMGYPGMLIGRGSWDPVIGLADSSQRTALILQACGFEVSGPSSTVPEAAGTSPPPIPSTPAASAFANFSAPTSSSETTLLRSSSSSSVSSSTSISLSHGSSTISTPSSLSTSSSQTAATSTAIAAKGQLAHPTSTPTSSQIASAVTTVSAKNSQTASSSSTSGDTSTNSDIESYLTGHNTVRATHGAQDLVWSDSLAASAQQWANGCLFQHSTSGENLAAGTGSNYDILAAIKSWVDEAASYNPNNPQPSHFTQVVWKSTTELGCGKQMCDGIFPESYGKALYVVCHYSSPGNVDDEYAQNVQV